MISLDFTINKYEDLCKIIKKTNYPVVRVQDYFEDPSLDQFIILRHDVDKLPDNALAMAKLEHSLDIRSTYYFRTVKDVFEPAIIKMISELCHEIGYHYENLSATEGDHVRALELFEADLTRLRKITEIKTICMHGSPMSKWNNSDLWKEYEFEDYGIIGEPYLSIDYKDIVYFTDTGRSWCDRGSVRDLVEKSLECKDEIKTTDDLMKVIEEQHFDKIIILAHPQRWSLNSSKWLKEFVSQNIKNIGKDLIIKRRR